MKTQTLTREESLEKLYEIIREHNVSITEIVEIKERAMNEKISEQNTLISGLSLRSCVMFGENPTMVLKNIEMVKPLVAKDILKTGIVRGTDFEKELLMQYP